jgi:hypothetical protein
MNSFNFKLKLFILLTAPSFPGFTYRRKFKDVKLIRDPLNHSVLFSISHILWKNAQKIAKKNNASDAINKATPKLIPRWTALV